LGNFWYFTLILLTPIAIIQGADNHQRNSFPFLLQWLSVFHRYAPRIVCVHLIQFFIFLFSPSVIHRGMQRGSAAIICLDGACVRLFLNRFMTRSQRQMRLGAFLQSVGHHLGAWRHPDVDPRDATRLQPLQHLARVAERGKFDAIFFCRWIGFA